MKQSINIDEYLWCPNCNHSDHIVGTVTVDINHDHEFRNFKRYLGPICPLCKKDYEHEIEMEYLDKNIAEPVILLNKKGYRTLFSCEGHGDNITYFSSYAYIMFENGEPLATLTPFLSMLPKGWISTPFMDTGNYSIEFTHPRKITDKESNDLLKWVETLPNYAASIEFPAIDAQISNYKLYRKSNPHSKFIYDSIKRCYINKQEFEDKIQLLEMRRDVIMKNNEDSNLVSLEEISKNW